MDQTYDLVETASNTGTFRVFLEALEAAGLKNTLKETGPYTIFAPVDEAFAIMPKAKLEVLFKPDNRDLLHLFLRNLIVPEKLLSSDLKQRDQMRSMKGEELSIESRAGLWVNEAEVIRPDLEASNGVLHGIQPVLMPQTT
jgi:uncharacterized surface protein with fasciclin (FAS1) repeats